MTYFVGFLRPVLLSIRLL